MNSEFYDQIAELDQLATERTAFTRYNVDFQGEIDKTTRQISQVMNDDNSKIARFAKLIPEESQTGVDPFLDAHNRLLEIASTSHSMSIVESEKNLRRRRLAELQERCVDKAQRHTEFQKAFLMALAIVMNTKVKEYFYKHNKHIFSIPDEYLDDICGEKKKALRPEEVLTRMVLGKSIKPNRYADNFINSLLHNNNTADSVLGSINKKSVARRDNLADAYALAVNFFVLKKVPVESIPDEVLHEIAEAYRHLVRKVELKNMERLNEQFVRAKQLIVKALLQGKIQVPVERVKYMFENVKICFNFSTENTGVANHAKESISVSIFRGIEGENQMLLAIIHEMLHLLEGKTVLAEKFGREFEDNKDHTILTTILRNGIQFSLDPSKIDEAKPCELFDFLNEALTEHLAAEIAEMQSGTYLPERKLLLEICKNVDITLFREAYFEDYDREAPVGQRTKAWKKLNDELKRFYGPGFLVKLNQLYSNGVLFKDRFESHISSASVV